MSRTWRRVKAKGRDRRRGSCDSGKVRYKTAEQAAAALAEIAARPHGKHVPVRAYACPSCAGFHLTAQRTWRP